MAKQSKYHTHVEPRLNEIAKWRRDGYTEKQIAKMLDIAYSTFKVYKGEHSALSDTLKNSRADLVIELEKSLYQKAMGFDYEETDITEYVDDSGGMRKQVVKKQRKALPDTGALAFALKNLAPHDWRDRRDVSLDGASADVVINITGDNQDGTTA